MSDLIEKWFGELGIECGPDIKTIDADWYLARVLYAYRFMSLHQLTSVKNYDRKYEKSLSYILRILNCLDIEMDRSDFEQVLLSETESLRLAYKLFLVFHKVHRPKHNFPVKIIFTDNCLEKEQSVAEEQVEQIEEQARLTRSRAKFQNFIEKTKQHRREYLTELAKRAKHVSYYEELQRLDDDRETITKRLQNIDFELFKEERLKHPPWWGCVDLKY